MGLFQLTPKCFVVFLVLIACINSLLITHARPIKPLMNQQSTLNIDGLGETDANSFRPTTPGSSPGVGHRNFVGENKNMKTMVNVQSPDVEVFATERSSDDGFKPTIPGHSPGVGHAYHTKIGHLH